MKKKTLYIITAIISVFLVFFLFVMEGNKISGYSGHYSEMMSDDLDEIIAERKYSDGLYAEICFDEIPLILDKSEDRLFYCIEDDDFERDPVVSCRSDSISILFEDKKMDDGMMADNETVRVLLYDKERYKEYRLVCTNVPVIDIRMFNDDLSGNYKDATVCILDNKSSYSYGEYDGKVRIRGGSSSEYPKPGLRIELDKILKGDNNTDEKMYDLFGLEKDNEYVLYTSNVEKDMIRNVFSTNLWYDTCASDNSFGLKAGDSYQYVEVLINDEYWGLCAIGNPIGKKRGYVDLNKDSDRYLIENIYKANFFGEKEYLDMRRHENYGIFSLKTNVDEAAAWDPLCDYLETLLYSKDAEELYGVMDIDNALDIYLYYDLIQAWDNVWYEDGVKFRNTYLVSKVDEEGKVKMLYLPWDLDRTWGHETETGDYLMDESINYEMIMIPIENLLEMNDMKIGKLISGKYRELRSGGWSDENILKMIDGYSDEIYGSGAFYRDGDRWPELEHGDDIGLAAFREYVVRRLHYFDQYIADSFPE